MKKIILTLSLILLVSGKGYCMYDFCESPADYNMCPDAFNIRTEYWKDIPNYHPDDNIKFKDMKNPKQQKIKHIKKSKTDNSTEQIDIKQD